MKEFQKAPFEIQKIVEVLKYIIEKHPNPDRYNVMKILYFADKIHLAKYGQLILDDKYIKMSFGPVPSKCYDIIKNINGEKSNYPLVKEEIKFISKDGLANLQNPDLEYLSKSNLECLNQSLEENKNLNFEALKSKSHDEIYNSVKGQNDPIPLLKMADILDKSGKLSEYIKETSLHAC
jgi:uncharacterized phage-associated protein